MLTGPETKSVSFIFMIIQNRNDVESKSFVTFFYTYLKLTSKKGVVERMFGVEEH